ncbi:hypothetical protein B0T19DRAFT_244239 [Cercophora scortea]|uniref:Transmembrane protein n=1 Tax=Cercophora scortea TaxID=314031 RepID=A0AAE0I8U0_9PEZI|nr:hypothetical protein B0T19DRAFT_244239 [Cercophora scortea]
MERFVSSTDCQCYVDTAEIQKGGCRDDPKICLHNCKSEFLRTVSPDWDDATSWPSLCQKITSNVPTSRFWPLYWCDSTFCGVWINQTGGVWQDPNVNLIINTCQNIGFHSILDPGPPPAEFACQTTDAKANGPCTQPFLKAPEPTSSCSVTVTSKHSMSLSLASSTSARTTTTSSTAVPSPAGASSSSATPTILDAHGVDETTATSGLSQGSKIAIAVCSTVALLVIICVALFCLRRRHRHRSSFHSHLRLAGGMRMPGGSPTPLISPANSATGSAAPLTPPLRLRDRRFLPAILRPGNRSPSPPLTPLTPAYSPGYPSAVFPASPICAPTTNKLVPRHERFPKAAAGGTAPPESRGSLGSFAASSMTGHSSLRNELAMPSSPPRPPRPHDTPLEIPDLVSPASPPISPLGPPPNRALPSPPPVSPTGTFAGGGTVNSLMMMRSALPPQRGVVLPRDASEFQVVDVEPAAAAAGERGSWGSWSGKGDHHHHHASPGGGAVPLSPVSPGRKTGGSRGASRAESMVGAGGKVGGGSAGAGAGAGVATLREEDGDGLGGLF